MAFCALFVVVLSPSSILLRLLIRTVPTSLCLLCALAACPFAVVAEAKQSFVCFCFCLDSQSPSSSLSLPLVLCLFLSFFLFSACSTESGLFIHPISFFFCVFAYHIYHCAFSCTHTHTCTQPPFTDRQLLCPANCTLAEINQFNVVRSRIYFMRV